MPSSKTNLQVKVAEKTTDATLTYLRSGNWPNLRQQFAPILRYFITEQMLEKAWKLIEVLFGSLEDVGSPTYSCGWFILTATVPVTFKKAKLNVRLQMTPSGHLFGLNLSPQLPVSAWKPASYAEDTASLRNTNMRFGKGLFKVGGTLTLPAKQNDQKCPCVILLGGSGPIDRDSTIGALKPFKDIALGLANNDIAVCRIDKTTLVSKLWFRLLPSSKQNITLTGEYGYAFDAINVLKSHPDIQADKIFVLGHSLGGLMAAHLAATDSSVAGCILMATPSEVMYRCAVRQLRYIASLGEDPASDGVQDMLSDAQELEKKADIADSSSLSLSTPASELPLGLGPAYWLENRDLNPLKTTKITTKPILILQGERDYQVTMDDYQTLQASLQGNGNAEFHSYGKLNHCFVAGQGPPSPTEYNIPGNVDGEVIRHIYDWVRRVVE